MDEPVTDMGYLSLPGETQEALEYRAGLRRRIDAALQDSIDRCARCKACDYQVDAVMAVLDAAPVRQPPGTVPVIREDLHEALTLADLWVPVKFRPVTGAMERLAAALRET